MALGQPARLRTTRAWSQRRRSFRDCFRPSVPLLLLMERAPNGPLLPAAQPWPSAEQMQRAAFLQKGGKGANVSHGPSSADFDGNSLPSAPVLGKGQSPDLSHGTSGKGACDKGGFISEAAGKAVGKAHAHGSTACFAGNSLPPEPEPGACGKGARDKHGLHPKAGSFSSPSSAARHVGKGSKGKTSPTPWQNYPAPSSSPLTGDFGTPVRALQFTDTGSPLPHVSSAGLTAPFERPSAAPVPQLQTRSPAQDGIMCSGTLLLLEFKLQYALRVLAFRATCPLQFSLHWIAY
jgi:hypothetical protein